MKKLILFGLLSVSMLTPLVAMDDWDIDAIEAWDAIREEAAAEDARRAQERLYREPLQRAVTKLFVDGYRSFRATADDLVGVALFTLSGKATFFMHGDQLCFNLTSPKYAGSYELVYKDDFFTGKKLPEVINLSAVPARMDFGEAAAILKDVVRAEKAEARQQAKTIAERVLPLKPCPANAQARLRAAFMKRNGLSKK